MNLLLEGDCLDKLRELEDNSVDSVVTDPPYGLSKQPNIEEVLTNWLEGKDYEHRGGGFMGKTWDSFVPGPAVWREVFRVLKPGGHILCFAGTRTVDLMGIAIRLGGFEIRDCLQWLYGSSFPKSLDVSKAIDKKLGAEREVVGPNPYSSSGRKPGVTHIAGGNRRPAMEARMAEAGLDKPPITAPATLEAKQWEGWGTSLKPAVEPIILARKPLSEKNIAANVLRWGTGGLNIDGCRIPTSDKLGGGATSSENAVLKIAGYDRPWMHDEEKLKAFQDRMKTKVAKAEALGRFPANVLLDEEAAEMLDEQNKGASRFFYVAKASKSERTHKGEVDNKHPTVKPIKLMRYLIRLVTPPGGTVLDPFAGSGTTLIAAKQEGFQYIGVEREPEYVELAKKRLEAAENDH